ncbi:MAG: endolytic transglycosylase MltG [Holosporaceae bacterium]|jgi:UPF0755 protein|nr:endolytic transglycosylase MltG [Holosporaceae bacterium]
MKNSLKNKITRLGSGFLAVVFIGAAFLGYNLFKESSYVAEKSVILERGGNENFARFIVDKKISSSFATAKFAIEVMKLFGYRAKFGEYALPDNVSLFEAIKIISSGKEVIHRITIPEGFSIVQVVRRLEEDENLLGKIKRIPREGSIMPDTYLFKYPTKRQEIISRAQEAMRQFIRREWPRRSPSCLLKNPNEALTLASIIEKETNIERELVAGVYQQRLKIGMKLQSCPSVIYSHKRGDSLGRSLRYSDLKIDDPYNTYIRKGLPPNPICNPGKDSIIAALHPEETDNIFFVYGGEGKHIFSKTYDEHKRNIAKVRNVKVSEVR